MPSSICIEEIYMLVYIWPFSKSTRPSSLNSSIPFPSSDAL